MALKRSGQIVLFRFPQTDLVIGKLRPALLLAPLPTGQNDWLVCMVSSQLFQSTPGIDEIIETTDEDFIQTGLKTSSVIRLTRLTVVEESVLRGTIGEISRHRLLDLKKRLADWIGAPDDPQPS
jgi:mRNA interferase MazF